MGGKKKERTKTNYLFERSLKKRDNNGIKLNEVKFTLQPTTT